MLCCSREICTRTTSPSKMVDGICFPCMYVGISVITYLYFTLVYHFMLAIAQPGPANDSFHPILLDTWLCSLYSNHNAPMPHHQS
jgi:hypothetical protein